MSSWKSRWSCVRFVKIAAAKWMPSARPSCERVRGDLDRAGPVAAVEHRAEVRLQVDRLGGRPSGSSLDPTDHRLDSPQQAAARARVGRLQQRRQEERRRRLPVRPGHAHDPQLGARIAVEADRRRAHRGARGGHQHLGHPEPERALDDERRRAARERLRGEVVPVALEARHAEEQAPRRDRAAVVGEARDLDRGRLLLLGALRPRPRRWRSPRRASSANYPAAAPTQSSFCPRRTADLTDLNYFRSGALRAGSAPGCR